MFSNFDTPLKSSVFCTPFEAFKTSNDWNTVSLVLKYEG